MTNIRIDSAYELFKTFLDVAHIKDEVYDKNFFQDLCKTLGLNSKYTEEDFNTISVENVLNAILHTMEPFSCMLSDLLEMYEEAGAQYGDNNLNIVVQFDEEIDKLEFDITSFRSAVTKTSSILKDDISELLPHPWKMIEALQFDEGLNCGETAEYEKITEWLKQYDSFPNGAWPDFFPDMPVSGIRRLDKLLDQCWKLWKEAVEVYQTKYDPELGRIESHKRACRKIKKDFWWAETDRWAYQFLERIRNIGIVVRRGLIKDESIQALEDNITNFLKALPAAKSIKEQVTVIEDILSLPFWKRRYEMYSAWVSTQIVDALQDRDIEYHTPNNTLSFSFKGSLIAKCNGFNPPVEIWAEKKTETSVAMRGAGRKSGIQPDYTLALASADKPENSLIVVECKQYKKSSTCNFKDAIIDYSNGRKNATIFLVDYGPISKNVFCDKDEKNQEILDRSKGYEYFRPHSEQAKNFKDLLKTELITRYQKRAEANKEDLWYPWTDISHECQIELSWGKVPQDLDLHLYIKELNSDRELFHIFYKNIGFKESTPYVTLNQDVRTGNGTEIIHISRWLEGEYHIIVENYSRETEDIDKAQIKIICGNDNLNISCLPSFDKWNVAQMNKYGIKFYKIS